MSASDKTAISSFNPSVLGEYILHHAKTAPRKSFVTLLIGAGFSRSAGIPVAGEIVSELREEAKSHPLLRNAGTPPQGKSEYAFLMENLGSPKERSDHVKKFVDRARDPATKRLKINWAHLLLASLVEQGYVNRILTTNFDPLIVEALAVTGQPIRTYDLNTTGKYCPGTLDPASVIYLHGQMHSLLLANSENEMKQLRDLYPKVLQEAVQDSILIVLGYSGECDPVLESLASLPNFPLGLWWSHYSSSGGEPGSSVQNLFAKHGSDCHLSTGDDSDTFMRKLVLDGMKLDLPDEVLKPVTAIKLALERITAFPKQDIQASDPLQTSLEILRRVEDQLKDPAPPSRPEVTSPTKKTSPQELSELAKALPIEMAALNGDWEEFDRLRSTVTADPRSRLSTAVGDGLVRLAGVKVSAQDPTTALRLLAEATTYGVTSKMNSWLPTIQGNALADQAKLKGNSPEADALFTDAYHKYSEALRIKPDKHEAFYNWGNALSDQTKLKGHSPEADTLFADAYHKYSEALRIKPDKHEALNNWGNALSDQAKLKGNSSAADALFTDACHKYSEALRLKPDKHEAFNNWGIALSNQAKLKGNSPKADALFTDAYHKYSEALRLKPDLHEAFNNWGAALSDQAKLKGNSPEADALFTDACHKFSEALRLKPDYQEALNNWGVALADQAKLKSNSPAADALLTDACHKYSEALRLKPDDHSIIFNLACLTALRNQPSETVAHLTRWRALAPDARKAALDNDFDFDPVRKHPEFLAFRAQLLD